jgi:hypothetical protein
MAPDRNTNPQRIVGKVIVITVFRVEQLDGSKTAAMKGAHRQTRCSNRAADHSETADFQSDSDFQLNDT